MESQGIKRIIDILRYITSAVQIIPFVFTAFYILCFSITPIFSDELKYICDSMFYVSPMVVASHLTYSKILKLCKWHRIACLLPTLPLIVSLLDYYVFSLSSLGAYVANSLIALMSVLLLISAYEVFFK